MEICYFNDTSSPLSPGQRTGYFFGEALRLAAYSTSLLFALPVNGFGLSLILTGKWERIASDLVPLNQMVIEIIFSLTAVWNFLQTFLEECFFFQMFLFFSSMFLIARPLAQSYLCMEQYLAIIHPVMFFRCKLLRYRLTCSCVSWLMVLVFSITSAVLNFRSEIFLVIAAFYLLFMFLMTFCCVSVLRALKHPGPGERQKDQQKGNRMKRRAFMIIIINLMHSTLSQVPLAVNMSLKGSIPPLLFYILDSLNIWAFVLTGFVPAILYLFRVRMLPKNIF